MEFNKVTEHYGYCCEIINREILYVIYNIKNGKAYNVVAGMKTKRKAIRECKYIESLNKKSGRKI